MSLDRSGGAPGPVGRGCLRSEVQTIW